jgi:hypothetical protein
MSDEREPDPETGAFDADEWFRTQFGGEKPAPAAPPVVPPASAEPPLTPPPLTPPPLTPPPVMEPAPTQPAAVIEPEPTQPAEIVPPGPTSPAPTWSAPTWSAAAGAPTETLPSGEPAAADGALDELFGAQSRPARRGAATAAPHPATAAMAAAVTGRVRRSAPR